MWIKAWVTKRCEHIIIICMLCCHLFIHSFFHQYYLRTCYVSDMFKIRGTHEWAKPKSLLSQSLDSHGREQGDIHRGQWQIRTCRVSENRCCGEKESPAGSGRLGVRTGGNLLEGVQHRPHHEVKGVLGGYLGRNLPVWRAGSLKVFREKCVYNRETARGPAGWSKGRREGDRRSGSWWVGGCRPHRLVGRWGLWKGLASTLRNACFVLMLYKVKALTAFIVIAIFSFCLLSSVQHITCSC